MRNRTRLGLLVAALLFSLQLWAQSSGRIRIVDAETGLPIASAAIVNPDGSTHEAASTEGEVENLADGAYISASGYRLLRYQLSMGRTVRLEAFTGSLPEVVTLAIRPKTLSATEINLNSAGGVQPLGSPAPANLGQDLPYLLQQTPSAVTTSDAGTGVGYTSIRVRGSDATRTNVTLDGVPVNDAESQGTFWVDLPDLASSVSKVTVARGVGSSTNGPGAFGATVALETNQPSDTAFLTVDNSGGSFGTRRHSVQAGTGKIGPGFTGTVRLSRIASDGYVDRATADLYSYLAVIRYQNQHGLSLRLLNTRGHERTYQAWNGVDKAQADTNPTYNSAGTDGGQRTTPYKNEVDDYLQDYWQLHISQQLGQGWRVGGALFYTHGEGYYEQYKVGTDLSTYQLALTTDTAYSDLVRRRWLRNDYFGATANVTLDTGRHSFTAGALGSRYQGTSFGRVVWGQTPLLPYPDFEYYSSQSLKQEVSGFARYSYSFPIGLRLMADAQVRAIDYRITGTDQGDVLPSLHKNWLFFNPKAGVSYATPWGTVDLTASVGHREPTRTTFTDTRGGNPRPERMIDYELNYRWARRKFRPGFTLYYMDYYDQLVQTGQLNDVGNALFRNIDRSYRAGIELQAEWQPVRQLKAAGSLSLSQNRLKAYNDTLYDDTYTNRIPVTFKDKAIAYSPSVTAQGRVTLMPVSSFEMTLFGRYIGLQYLDNTENKDRSLPAYAVADLRLAYQLPVRWAKALRLTVQVNNLTNARYSNNGYSYYTPSSTGGVDQNYVYVYPQAGINFLAGVLISL